MKRILLTIGLLMGLSVSMQAKTVVRIDALNENLWEQSQWISVVNAPVVTGKIKDGNIRAADGASWFVTQFKNEKKVASAKWMATSLGIHQIFVNKSLVGEEVLKPGFTHPQKTKIAYTYDITPLINKAQGAENVFSAQVTPGWWADHVLTPKNHEGMVGKKCAFRAILEITYTDGSVKHIGTDLKNWKAGIAGPVTHAGIFDGESYDARILPGYATPEKLSTPELNQEFPGEIVPSAGAEIYWRKDLTLSPKEAYTWKGIEGASETAYGKVKITKQFKAGSTIKIPAGETLVVDFGQNAAAVPYFEFKAAEGTTLTCLPGEILNDGNGAHSRGMDGPEGSVHRLNLRIAEHAVKLEYTFAGKKEGEIYAPRCTFFGYRYVSITATNDVEITSIQSIPVTSITREMETGRITTGNASINQLLSNTLWGMYSNYLSVPTDCPQRNERLGWTADTQVFTETGSFFANTSAFMHKWMRDLRDSQAKSGAYSSVAPTALGGRSLMRLGWADAGIIIPWIIWKQFNDTELVKECWESMERFIDHVAETKYELENIKEEAGNNQYADWLSYEPLETSGHAAHYRDENNKWQPRPESIIYWNFMAQCYWLMDAEMMSDMAKAIGKDDKKFQAQMIEARELLKRYFNEDGTFKLEILNTMQTPALFVLRCNLLEGKAKEDMIARLRENFKAHDNCLQTGFLGTSLLMSTLTENGMLDIAYELLFQRKNPSWLYSVDNGATTIWERWNSYMKENGMGPRGMNSFNHYAYGCVCEWIWEVCAGISCDVDGVGFKHFTLKPVPDKRLGFVEASYKTPNGLIKSAWKYKGDQWIWNFTIPRGTTASVILPGETQAKTYNSGNYKIVLK